jgi:diguanylate cyclase (GGDEF)-like protein
MSPQSATAFLLLGAELILVRARKRFSSHVADAIILCLGMLVLTLVSGYLFGALRVFGLSASTPTSPQTLFCLLLLTQVALFRRAEHGLYSILLWRGIGGRIARTLSPVLLALPFLREATRAHFISSSRMPSHYVTAILASLAATLSFALLLLLSWYIHGMEVKIRDLSLRDELTGLYNLRGFSLFAEQALLMAHRSSLPFSVLFIDLDNLKQTNDSLGHSAGSALLSETGKILNASFRKTDVVGRIGGDEFAVAGQLSEAAISAAAQRLREAVAFRDSSAGLGHALTLSIGHFTSEEDAHYTLNELLSKADKAMYEEKSGKKPRAD